MNKTMPSVLIVILNYQTYQLTIELIEDLKKHLLYDNYTVMVIDNDSPNESSKVLAEHAKQNGYIFLANNKNAGYAAGNNIGIRYGILHGYSYSWILNNDVKLREGNILTHMVNILQRDSKIACVGPQIYSQDGNIVAPYCRRPSFWTLTIGFAAEKYYRKKYINFSREVYRVHGCCMLLKNRVMEKIEAMDERTFLYREEDILAERLMTAGFKTFYDANVSILHNESSTINKTIFNRKDWKRIEAKKSRELYLKEYRKFPIYMRWACHISSDIVSILRNSLKL